jgi:hypothetical protein
MLEEVAEAVATLWDFMVDVDEAEGDGVVRDVEDHGFEVGDGVVGTEFNPGGNGLLGIDGDFAGVIRVVSG